MIFSRKARYREEQKLPDCKRAEREVSQIGSRFGEIGRRELEACQRIGRYQEEDKFN